MLALVHLDIAADIAGLVSGNPQQQCECLFYKIFLDASYAYVLAGVKQGHGSHIHLRRLPITQPLLNLLLQELETTPWLSSVNQLMFRMACALTFHGFFCGSELTSGLLKKIFPIKRHSQQHRQLLLQASKKDPFQRDAAITIDIGSSKDTCCTVGAMST